VATVYIRDNISVDQSLLNTLQAQDPASDLVILIARVCTAGPLSGFVNYTIAADEFVSQGSLSAPPLNLDTPASITLLAKTISGSLQLTCPGAEGPTGAQGARGDPGTADDNNGSEGGEGVLAGKAAPVDRSPFISGLQHQLRTASQLAVRVVPVARAAQAAQAALHSKAEGAYLGTASPDPLGRKDFQGRGAPVGAYPLAALTVARSGDPLTPHNIPHGPLIGFRLGSIFSAVHSGVDAGCNYRVPDRTAVRPNQYGSGLPAEAARTAANALGPASRSRHRPRLLS
jgi:hypothetical protein